MAEKLEPEDEDKYRSVVDRLPDAFTPSVVPLAPDGGPAPGAFTPEPVSAPPEALCKSGPCRHFWEFQTPMATANPENDYLEMGLTPPREIYQSCLAHTGTETQLSNDAPVLECNRWDPAHPHELFQLELRRRIWREKQARDAASAELQPENEGVVSDGSLPDDSE